jgi:parallel beta-helix repeat protein
LRGIRLFNPQPADDGFTENNFVYNNTIINSENGIEATRSHDNILESNIFSNIQSSEHRLSGGSSMIIRGQQFNNTIISQENSPTESHVEIADSGIIEIREGRVDDEEEVEEIEEELYYTDIEPYRRILSGGDDITVTSSVDTPLETPLI